MHGIEVGELFDVGARAEELPAGGQNDDPDRIVRFQLPKGLIQFPQDRRAEEIRRRVVQGDGGEAFGDGNGHVFSGHLGAPGMVCVQIP